ncbi:MAG: NifB/NifX family molybdenum-iron cluster-binding protein [Spirochaetales bacterium]|nr:NifB/NifX family molybdenum-iron cluster-binding protein [Spirochaetales bacterium]
MKIAIPCVEGKLCAHFGHCNEFAIITTEGKKIVKNESVLPPPHEPGVLPAWLHNEHNVNVIIAGGMGVRAQELFAQNQITVKVGAPARRPEELVEALLNETLVTGENLCDH